MKDCPYIGPKPFTWKEKNLFKGRMRETRDLVALIHARPVVLVYAPSGAGKTSLMNAQVVPSLQERDCVVLAGGRVKGKIPPDIEPSSIANIYTFNLLTSLSHRPQSPQKSLRTTLREFVREQARELDASKLPRLLVLILDQFEEFFTCFNERWSDRAAFFRDLDEAFAEERRLRVVISMREEYIARLDPLAKYLPGQLETRFRLTPLSPESALRAIAEPAREAGVPFERGVAEKLVDNLRKISPADETQGEGAAEFVEPLHLQVVCLNLWEGLPEQAKSISEKSIADFGDVNEALGVYYENCVKQLVRGELVSEIRLRAWFSNKLILSDRTRGLVYKDDAAGKTAGLPNAAVQVLDELHLIRPEERGGKIWYELSHDRFVAPIVRLNNAWLGKMRTRLVTQIVVVAMTIVIGFAIVTGQANANRERDQRQGNEVLIASRLLAEEPLKVFTALAYAIKAVAPIEARNEVPSDAALYALRKASDIIGDGIWLRTGSALRGIGVSSDGARVLLINESAVSVWQVDGSSLPRRLFSPISRGTPWAYGEFSPGGNYVLAWSESAAPGTPIQGQTSIKQSMAEARAHVWRADNGEPVEAIASLLDAPEMVGTFSVDDRVFLATSPGKREARVYEAKTGEEIASLLAPPGTSPDGRVAATYWKLSPSGGFATVTGNYTAQVWSVANGGKVQINLDEHLPTGVDPVRARAFLKIAFSSDDRQMMALWQNGNVSQWDLWDVAEKRQTRSVQSEQSGSYLAASADLSWLLFRENVESAFLRVDATSGSTLLKTFGQPRMAGRNTGGMGAFGANYITELERTNVQSRVTILDPVTGNVKFQRDFQGALQPDRIEVSNNLRTLVVTTPIGARVFPLESESPWAAVETLSVRALLQRAWKQLQGHPEAIEVSVALPKDIVGRLETR